VPDDDKPRATLPSESVLPKANSTYERPDWHWVSLHPGPGEPGYSQDVRRDLTEDHAQSERSSQKTTVSEDREHTTWTGQVLEFVGLGFILVPPALLGEAFLKREPVDWQVMSAIFGGYWAVGAVVLFAGKKWPKWRPSNETIAGAIEKGIRNVWVWFALLAVFAFGPSLLDAAFSGRPSATVNPIVVSPHPPTSNAATLPTSSFLGLDDAMRWQLSTTLQDALRGSSSVCDAHVWGKPSSNTSAAFWNEFQPILHYSGWLIQGGPTPKTVFPDGVTLLVGSDHGGAFDGAFRLSELLQKMTVRPVTLRINQITPDLIACKNFCLEIVIWAMSPFASSEATMERTG
jgi:hypothetical protein